MFLEPDKKWKYPDMQEADVAHLAIEIWAEQIWCWSGFATVLIYTPASGAGGRKTAQLNSRTSSAILFQQNIMDVNTNLRDLS